MTPKERAVAALTLKISDQVSTFELVFQKEVKRLVGDKVALCGNVNCALMQTGTDEELLISEIELKQDTA